MGDLKLKAGVCYPLRVGPSLNLDELRVLAEMGRALWVDPRESQLATVETVSAVSLLDLAPDRAVERAAAALLDRVSRSGVAANTFSNVRAGMGIQDVFFRLIPEDRFLLVALHLGRWSYARLSRVLNKTPEQIEERAWSARVRLAASQNNQIYPSGGSLGGVHCPNYDSRTPWTQRFLDEEVQTGRERAFLQNHLMACDGCRDTLIRCREIYYAIDRLLPRLSEENGDERVVQNLATIALRGMGLAVPKKSLLEMSFVETCSVFIARKDVQWVLGMLGLLLVWKLIGKR